MRDDGLKARLAINADGPAMARLASASGYTFEGFEIDWSQIEPYWLVVEFEGEIVGGVQVLPGKPVGRVEILLMHPDLPFKRRVNTYRLLAWGALQALKASGSQLAAGMFPVELPDYQRFAERRGWRRVASGELLMARLR